MSAQNSLDNLLIQCKKAIDQLRQRVIQAQIQNIEDNPTPLKIKSNGQDDKPSSSDKTTFRMRKILRGHFGKIYRSDWSIKNDIATVAQDEKIIIWNGSTGNKKSIISLNEAWRMALSWSLNGNYIGCGGLDNACTIYVLSEQDGWREKVILRGHDGYISDCDFINDNYIITSSGDSNIILWDIESKQIIRRYQGHSADVMRICTQNNHILRDINSHDDSNLVLSTSIDGTIKLWDIRENIKSSNNESDSGSIFTYYGHLNDVNACQWFPNGHSFASGSDDGTVRLWDISSKRQMNIYLPAPYDEDNPNTNINANENNNNNNNNNSPMVSNDIDNSNQLNYHNNNSPNNLIGRKSKVKLSSQTANLECSVMDVEFSQSGGILFAGLDSSPFCTSWKTVSGDFYQHLIHINRVSSIHLSPDGNCILTACWDRYCRIWA